MTKRIKTLLILAVFTVCFAVSGLFALNGKVEAEIMWSDVSIEESYLAGTSFEVPSRKLFVDGKEYEASAKVIRPDGTATSASTVLLQTAGVYTLQYYVENEEVSYSETLSFTVNEKAFSFTGEESSFVYGKGAYKPSPETEGVYVRLQEKDVLSVSQIINIPAIDDDISLVNYFIAPDESGSADFSKITFTFTDVSDPSCYLQIVAQSSRPDTDDGKGGCYLLAGGNGQQLKGDQGGGKIHVNNGYGARSDKGSFFGYKVLGGNSSGGLNLEAVSDPSVLAMGLTFNPVTCEVKANGTIIIDTDSKAHFGGASDVKWTGFVSGSVRLSVKCEGYNTSSANFVLTYIKDTDLGAEGCEDKTPPVVTVNTEYGIENMPLARAGENEYYSVPAATAYDLISGECEVNVEVYKFYGTESETRINVVNGKFNTREAADYAIVYSASDAAGNYSAPVVVYVVASERVPEITFNVKGIEDSYEAGHKVTVPKPEVSGGSGSKTVTARAYFGETEFVFDNYGEEWFFYPETLGEWTIEYSATDYTEHTAKHEETISVVAASAPFTREELSLPRVFIAGLGNRLPELTVYDYTTGNAKIALASVSVKDGNGTKEYKSGEIFVPAVANNGDAVEVTYFYDNGTSRIEKGPFEVPAILSYEDEKLSVGNYFMETEENSIEKTVTDYGVKIEARAEEHSWLFANALVAEGFDLTFGGLKDNCVYDTMTVVLSDSVNDAKKLEIVFERSEYGVISFRCGDIGDGLTTDSREIDGGNFVQNIKVSIVRGRLLINGYAYDIEKYSDGSAFDGFTSGKVNLSFEVNGIEENSVYYVSSVNSYTITRVRQDRSAPNISVNGNYGGFYNKGDEYVINSAVSADVLAPEVDFKLTVTDGEGNYVTAKDGTLLNGADPTAEYVIVLEKYGEYTVTYTSVENNAPRLNENTFTYAVSVIDDEAPTFEMTGSSPKEIKKGDVVTLPKFTAADNLTSAENIVTYVIVRNPNGRRVFLTEDSYKFDFEGEYEIRYYFCDEAGNTSSAVITITVK